MSWMRDFGIVNSIQMALAELKPEQDKTYSQAYKTFRKDLSLYQHIGIHTMHEVYLLLHKKQYCQSPLTIVAVGGRWFQGENNPHSKMTKGEDRCFRNWHTE
ncbi:hypothetical protein [Nitrosopumilus sp.]|uniref:hypothetical protein n=1 Tax=Nitrosopumilus sp. TaxID=2024843 RepID=UPI00292E04C8|nr:hypothetical protein [Nitrosopumilus sp.]